MAGRAYCEGNAMSLTGDIITRADGTVIPPDQYVIDRSNGAITAFHDCVETLRKISKGFASLREATLQAKREFRRFQAVLLAHSLRAPAQRRSTKPRSRKRIINAMTMGRSK